MKESFSRLAAWAKAHPYYAGAILVLLILAVYVTIKRGGGGGGFSGGGVDASDLPDDSGASSSSDIGSGSFANLGSPGNDTLNTPSESNTPAPIGAGDGGYSGGNDQSNDYEMSAPADYVIPPSSYAMAQGAPISSQGMNSLTLQATASGGVKGEAPQTSKQAIQATAAGGAKGEAPQEQKKTVQAVAKAQPAKATTPKATTTKATTAKPVTPKTTTTKTHAELVGLPRLYNGYYGGYIYVLGMRTFSTPAGSGTKGGAVKKR